MSAEKKRVRATLGDIERAVFDGHALLETHVGEWRLKGCSTRSAGPDDHLVYQQELHEAGPFMVTADPQGKVGQWVVQLVRTRVTERVGGSLVRGKTKGPKYVKTIDVQLQIFDESGPLDPFVDPLTPVARTTPTMLAELATIHEIPKSAAASSGDTVIAHGLSELEIAAAYEEQAFCLGWLRVCFAPPAEGGPAAPSGG